MELVARQWGAAAAGPGKRGEGAIAGAKRGALHGTYSGGIVSPFVGAGAGARVRTGETLAEQKARAKTGKTLEEFKAAKE